MATAIKTTRSSISCSDSSLSVLQLLLVIRYSVTFTISPLLLSSSYSGTFIILFCYFHLSSYSVTSIFHLILLLPSFILFCYFHLPSVTFYLYLFTFISFLSFPSFLIRHELPRFAQSRYYYCANVHRFALHIFTIKSSLKPSGAVSKLLRWLITTAPMARFQCLKLHRRNQSCIQVIIGDYSRCH
jgi:hypothetical protein